MLKTFIMLFDNALYLPIVLTVLFVLKLYYFLKNKKPTWKLSNFIHFNEIDIISSSSHKSVSAKKRQNYFTQLILSFLVLNLVVLAMELWFRR